MTTAAIVPAAGRGERLGPGTPKALRPLGGVPMLVHAVRTLARARSVDLVVVAAPEASLAVVRRLLLDHEVGASVQAVAGGATRQESVARALSSLRGCRCGLVHDAARRSSARACRNGGPRVRDGADAVVPGLPVPHVKRVGPRFGHATVAAAACALFKPRRGSTQRAGEGARRCRPSVLDVRMMKVCRDRAFGAVCSWGRGVQGHSPAGPGAGRGRAGAPA